MNLQRGSLSDSNVVRSRRAVAIAQVDPRPGVSQISARLWLTLCAFVILLVSVLPLKAATREEVADFLEVTGFDVALESIKLSAESGPIMLGMQDTDFATTWNVLTDSVFDVTVIQNMGLEIIQNAIAEEDLKFADDFYSSDLGQRLVEVENMSHMSSRADRMADASAELEQLLDSGANERIAILDRLNRAADTSDGAGDVMAEVQFRFLRAARDAGVIEFRVDDEELYNRLLDQSKAAREAGRMDSLASAALTYKDFSNEDLAAYADALEDPAMQRVYELMNAVQSEILANRFEAMAAKLEGVQPSSDL